MLHNADGTLEVVAQSSLPQRKASRNADAGGGVASVPHTTASSTLEVVAVAETRTLGALNTGSVLEAAVRVVLARPGNTSDCPAPPRRPASTHLHTAAFHYQMSPTAQSTAKTRLSYPGNAAALRPAGDIRHWAIAGIGLVRKTLMCIIAGVDDLWFPWALRYCLRVIMFLCHASTGHTPSLPASDLPSSPAVSIYLHFIFR